jgi:hypothetical protein
LKVGVICYGKGAIIERDGYLLSCCSYVELNPVRAGIVAKAEDIPWSSYQERLSNIGEMMLVVVIVYVCLASTETERQQNIEHCWKKGCQWKRKGLLMILSRTIN